MRLEPEATANGQEVLSTTPPTAGQRRTAVVIAAVSLVGLLAVAPFAHLQLQRVDGFIPAYQAALFVCSLLTAVLVGWQLAQVRTLPLLVLTAAYLYNAAIMVPHALAFPGAFSPHGLLGGGQSTAWLWVSWHAGFPLFVIAYALVDRRCGRGGCRLGGALAVPVLIAAGGVLLLVAALTAAAATADAASLQLLAGHRFTAAFELVVTPAVWLVSLAALLLLRPWRPRSALDLWLAVVMFVWLLDVGASHLGGARYDLGFFAGRVYELLATLLLLVLLLLELGRLYERLARTAALEARARVLASVVAAQEETRLRIARELHDELGGHLTGLRLGLDLLARRCGEEAVADLGDLLWRLDDGLHALARELRPPALDDGGLRGAVADLASRLGEATGMTVHLHDEVRLELPRAVQTATYRLVQEALTNAARHSRAETVSVRLAGGPGELEVVVEDDGIGFEPAAAGAGRLGLVGMRERVQSLHGSLDIHSAPGRGTTLVARLPLDTEA